MKHIRQESLLMKLFELNPAWTSRLMDRKWHSVQPGWELRLEYYVSVGSDGSPQDCLQFFFRYEGRDVGSMDQESGGFMYLGGIDNYKDVEDDCGEMIARAMDAGVEVVQSLFPKFYDDHMSESPKQGWGPWAEDPFEQVDNEHGEVDKEECDGSCEACSELPPLSFKLDDTLEALRQLGIGTDLTPAQWEQLANKNK